MRAFWLFVMYVAGVVAGSALIAQRQGDVRLVASRAMPAGHVLETGDLALAVDGRQYLLRAVEAQETLSAHEVETLDSAVRTSTTAPVAVRARRTEAFRRNFASGDELFVCPLDIRATFRTMFCGDEDAPCIIVAEVTQGDESQMAEFPALVLREGGTCEGDGDAD